MNCVMRAAVLANILLIASCTSVRPAPKPPPAPPVDHFKIWKVEDVPFNRQVMLKGQFDELARKAQVDSIVYLANPVRKNDEPINDPNTHLVAYFLHQPETPEPRRWVLLSNQFGTARWRLTDPALLLIPATKTFPPRTPPKPAASLDHFLCYLVRETASVDRGATLVDQFDQRLDTVERVSKLEAAFFCVPVEKNGEKIINGKTHLAIYDISPRQTLQAPITVWTRDQLRPSILTVTQSLMLAVPSEKIQWGPDEGGDDIPARSR